MKNIKSLLVLVAFTFCLLADAQAQERKISEQEMNAAGKNWTFRGKAYRLKKETKSINKADGKVTIYYKDFTEYSASGDYRNVSEHGRSLENIYRDEFIIIGKTVYTLNPSGIWRVSELRVETEEQKARRIAQYTEPEKVTEYFYKGKTTLNNQEADLYETKTIEKSIRKGREFINVVTTKRWYGRDGQLLKNEWTADNELSNTYTIFEFELDPNIKIEVPIK